MVHDCQPIDVPPQIMNAIVKTESSGNPYAIGVVNGELVRQPRKLDEAVATARMLDKLGYNYSLGAAQINKSNFKRLGFNRYEQSFDFCKSVEAGSKILNECYKSAGYDWGKAFSCYYSGNYTTGYKHGYVSKIFNNITSERKNYINLANSKYKVNHNSVQQEFEKDLNKLNINNSLTASDSNSKSRSKKITLERLKGGGSNNKQGLNSIVNVSDDKAFVF